MSWMYKQTCSAVKFLKLHRITDNMEIRVNIDHIRSYELYKYGGNRLEDSIATTLITFGPEEDSVIVQETCDMIDNAIAGNENEEKQETCQ